METKKAYLIKDITEYGKFISYCIHNDIAVCRAYWDEREAGNSCYSIKQKERRCCLASRHFYETLDYEVVMSVFQLDRYGNYMIIREENIIDE